MRSNYCILPVVAYVTLVLIPATIAEGADCPGKPAANWRPSKDELNDLLTAHKMWDKSARQAGCQARLEGTDLREVNLSGAQLNTALLTGANLSGADLSNANLSGAHLSNAILSGARLINTDLNGTQLYGADLRRAHAHRVNLSGAHAAGANLSGAVLLDANLSRAELTNANLSDARLLGADLTGARMYSANLSGAILSSGTNVANASFDFAELWSATFEPSSAHTINGIEFGAGLSTLRFSTSPTALVLVRKDFLERGLQTQASELTYAIRRQHREHAWEKWPTAIEAAFNYAAFEITCGYGLHRGRPLRILAALIPLFSVLYLTALVRPSRRGGLWRVWSPDRILKHQGQPDPERLSTSIDDSPGKPKRRLIYRALRVLSLGLYMSILSAFHIGWRDLNVGTWITRLQPREYTLRATGWVRVVSGLQSLISVYLLALWILTYFGRPFD
jgi:uncharacterized protein YjbI with pentapeptide repeats